VVRVERPDAGLLGQQLHHRAVHSALELPAPDGLHRHRGGAPHGGEPRRRRHHGAQRGSAGSDNVTDVTDATDVTDVTDVTVSWREVAQGSEDEPQHVWTQRSWT